MTTVGHRRGILIGSIRGGRYGAYEQSLATAQALAAPSIGSATSSGWAISSLWSWILFAGLMTALVIGAGIAFRNDPF